MQFCVIKSKTLLAAAGMILVAVLLSVSINGNAFAEVFFARDTRKIPIYNVKTNKKEIAISFDAAWGADKTVAIMDILEQYNAEGTFFLVGFWIDKYPDIVKQIDERGFSIGTHSNTHPDMAKLSLTQVKLELETSVSKIKAITKKPVNLFRAPFGSYNNALLEECERQCLYPIQWDVDSLDWQGGSGSQIASRVIQRVKEGSIILCHNNADGIVDALPSILQTLQARGYKFVKIDDLIYKNNYFINTQGTQVLNAA